MSQRGVIVATVASVVILFLLSVAPVDAGKEKEWIVTKLPSLDGWAGTIGNDVSDSGYIGGLWFDEDGGGHAAYWYKNEAYDLEDEIGIPEGMTDSGVYSINSAGFMLGNAWESTFGTQVGVLWDVKKGTMEELHAGDDYYASVLLGLNASGSAAGFAVDGTTFQYAPWVWPKGDTTGEALPMDDYDAGVAYGINSSGTVAGASYGDDPGSVYAAVWIRTGKGEYEFFDVHAELAEEDASVLYSLALDVGEDGTVVGQVVDTDFVIYAFEWSAPDGLTLLDMDEDVRALAWKKKSKYIVGGLGGSPAIADDACVWVNGELEVLPDLPGFPYMEGSSINGSGLVVGYAFDERLTTYQGWCAEKK